ncbi:hypothetical protein ACFS4T_13655 [Pseudomonas lini]
MRVIVIAQQQLFIERLYAASDSYRVFVGRPGFKSCQGSHGIIISLCGQWQDAGSARLYQQSGGA